jgi:hypothetical protein
MSEDEVREALEQSAADAAADARTPETGPDPLLKEQLFDTTAQQLDGWAGRLTGRWAQWRRARWRRARQDGRD